MKKFYSVSVLCLAALLLLAGCKAAQVAFPAGSNKAAFERYDVQGRRAFAIASGTYTFGPYTVDWTRSSKRIKSSEQLTFAGKEDTSIATQTCTIEIRRAGGPSWKGECRSGAEFIKETTRSKKVTTVSTQVFSNTLSCILKSPDGRTIELRLSQDKQGMTLYTVKRGSVSGGGTGFDIESTGDIEGTSWGLGRDSGFYIRESGNVVAVVDVNNEGRVYFAKDLGKDGISVLAAAAAALLSYRDLMKD